MQISPSSMQFPRIDRKGAANVMLAEPVAQWKIFSSPLVTALHVMRPH
jgi:hypothetical protein